MRTAASICMLFAISATSSFAFFGKNKELDNRRISLLNDFAAQIEAYRTLQGHYPLGDGKFEVPAVVYLNRSIKDVDYPIHYENVTVYDYEVLEAELKNVLGDDYREFNDPVEEYKDPSRYISKYYLAGNTFLVTANMSSAVKLSIHNTFREPKERRYTNKSKIQSFTFHHGFMHRYSLSTIANADYHVFRVNDLKKLSADDYKVRKFSEKLLSSVSEGDHEKVRELIENGVDVNPYHLSFNSVISPLIFAIRKNDLEMMEILLAAGADANARGGYEDPVLIYALMNDTLRLEKAELLLRYGASPNTPNFFGISPFIGACKLGDETLIRLLLENNAKLYQRFFYREGDRFHLGRSPIEAAIESDQLEVVKLLVEHGVEVGLRDPATGESPLEFAMRNQKEEAYKLMESIGK